jgi:transaldolase
MKFFIDSANLAEIRTAWDLGILDGVTTNPTLIAKEGIKGVQNILNHYKNICEIVKEGDISAEVISTDYDEMIQEAVTLSKIHKNIVVKIPMTTEGLKAISYLNKQGIPTNCTLVFSPGQAILAAKAGATYVSPFIGRLDDVSFDGIELIKQIKTIFNQSKFNTQILAASIRHVVHIVKCAEIGVDVVTCPLSVILGLLKHPLTDIGLKRFLDDYKNSQV